MAHVLISGGSRGIGASAVIKFAVNGYKVSYLFVNEAKITGENIFPIRCDVSDPDAVRDSVAAAVTKFGDIDILVSNSGISMSGLATDFGFEDYRKIMDVNFGGLFNLTSEIIPSMVRRKKGNIIAVSSMWGQTGASCEALYSATKGAVDSYVKSLAKELGPSGIRVNAISPGVINTDMMKEFSEEAKKELADETPIGRIGKPSEAADLIFYLASDSSSFITGQVIGVNGGFLI
ncbi:MAG: SDR family oxidoreductase [Clostridiales bacterium]|nr:SDR family oxidoreductase [Clostridiales bacterium]